MASLINFLLCYLVLSTCDAYKILLVYPTPAKSHGILGEGVIRSLLKAGHEVTYITAIEYKNPPPKLRVIDVTENEALKPTDTFNLEYLLDNPDQENPTKDVSLMLQLMNSVLVMTIENPDVQKLLNDPTEEFDVVIVEWMFIDLLSGLAPIFGCPLIYVSSVEVDSAILSLIDAAPNPAYTADVMSEAIPPFTFTQRVSELFKRVAVQYLRFSYLDDMEEQEYNRLLAPLILKRGRQPPSYSDARSNISLILGNSHVSMGLPLTLPQSYKSIGGYHINEEVKPLPEDLKKIMDNGKNGVIYFSMGSNLQSKHWPSKIKSGLLEMFGNLKQTVLWKFEEDLPNVPKNVHILKWAPQPSILSHPNCVLFITHGGLLSTTETIHYGVPIIGIPVFGDQFINVKRAMAKGFALEVKLSHALVDDLKAAIQEMMNNPRYKETVKRLSFIYHDRPVKPSAELAHWVQHVVRTRGAPHLRSPALEVPLYQRMYLDLAALLAVAVAVLIVLLRKMCAAVCSKKKVDNKKKNK